MAPASFQNGTLGHVIKLGLLVTQSQLMGYWTGRLRLKIPACVHAHSGYSLSFTDRIVLRVTWNTPLDTILGFLVEMQAMWRYFYYLKHFKAVFQPV